MNKWINVSPNCWFQTPQRFLMKVQTSRESHRWVQQFSSTNYSHHQGFSFFILETRPNKPPAEITLSPTKTNILPYFIDLLQIKIPAALITWGAVSVRIHQFSHSSCGLSFSVFFSLAAPWYASHLTAGFMMFLLFAWGQVTRQPLYCLKDYSTNCIH